MGTTKNNISNRKKKNTGEGGEGCDKIEVQEAVCKREQETQGKGT